MKDENIIITGKGKPFWALIISALAFTAIVGILLSSFLYSVFNLNSFKKIGAMTEIIIYLAGIGIGFGSQKRVYVNIKESKFKSSLELGPIKIGKWNTIDNYEYVSLFYQLLGDGSYIFEVNLWYDKNKHFLLYSEYDFEDALAIAFDLSEELNIDLLDATIPNDYKWIDKEALKQKTTSS